MVVCVLCVSVVKDICIARFQIQLENTSFHFLSKLLCSNILVFCGQLKKKIVFILIKHDFVGLNMGLCKIQQSVAFCMVLFLNFFVTVYQYRYSLMCSLKTYDNIDVRFVGLYSYRQLTGYIP